MKTKVYVRHLKSEYQKESRTKFLPLSKEMTDEIKSVIYEILDNAGGSTLLKSSKNVYIKPNGIDGKAYCFTRPELVRAVIDYFKDHGANKIYLFENSTQSNFTRLVFELTGYAEVCRKTGAIPVYLDEVKGEIFKFDGKDDYENNTFEMPNFVI